MHVMSNNHVPCLLWSRSQSAGVVWMSRMCYLVLPLETAHASLFTPIQLFHKRSGWLKQPHSRVMNWSRWTHWRNRFFGLFWIKVLTVNWHSYTTARILASYVENKSDGHFQFSENALSCHYDLCVARCAYSVLCACASINLTPGGVHRKI